MALPAQQRGVGSGGLLRPRDIRGQGCPRPAEVAAVQHNYDIMTVVHDAIIDAGLVLDVVDADVFAPLDYWKPKGFTAPVLDEHPAVGASVAIVPFVFSSKVSKQRDAPPVDIQPRSVLARRYYKLGLLSSEDYSGAMPDTFFRNQRVAEGRPELRVVEVRPELKRSVERCQQGPRRRLRQKTGPGKADACPQDDKK